MLNTPQQQMQQCISKSEHTKIYKCKLSALQKITAFLLCCISKFNTTISNENVFKNYTIITP